VFKGGLVGFLGGLGAFLPAWMIWVLAAGGVSGAKRERAKVRARGLKWG
jgi:hypothetical protein